VDFPPVALNSIMGRRFQRFRPYVELCNELRAMFSPMLSSLSSLHSGCWESTAVLKALKENTTVERMDFSMLFKRHYTKKFALVAAEYVESNKTLQTLHLGYGRNQENPVLISHFLRSLSRNTSVSEFIIYAKSVKCASVAFQELLTCTQTIKKLQIIASEYDEAFNEEQIATIASGFVNNTTLRDVHFQGWREADLAPVLTALQRHPTLEKIQ
jgi:hypothetical protein